MTRFARAQGSKASNARTPEEATSWSEMRQQLLESNSQSDGRDVPTQSSEGKYSFSHDKEADKPSASGEWAEFDTPKEKKKKHKKCKDKSPLKSDDELHSVNDSGRIKKKKKEKKIKANHLEAFNKSEEEKVESTEIPPKVKNFKNKKLDQYQATQSNVPQVKNLDQSTQLIQSQAVKVKKRRKPIEENRKIVVDGRSIEIENFDGFPVKKEDAIRLRELKKKMLNQGIPKVEVQKAMKLERRRAEKALSRERRKVCFHCRGSGHLMSECPALVEGSCSVCFKCGSTEHMSSECHVTHGNDYKFGQCFVCGEQGHIARQCPDNPRGLYPQGGGCRVCGDVTHLKKDCPDLAEERRECAITLGTSNQAAPLEALDGEEYRKEVPQPTKKNKIIKF